MRLKKMWLVAACLAVAACTGAEVPVGNNSTHIGQPPTIDPNTGCPVGMPRYKCEQIKALNADDVPVVEVAGTTLDEKALYAVEALYNVPATAYVVADTKGQLPATVKAVAKPKLIAMHNALKAARTAYNVGNSDDFFEAAANLSNLSNEVNALLPQVK